MTKILWISRHEMSPEQVEDLQKIYGDYQLEQWSKTLESVEDVRELITWADVIAAVLPLPQLLQMAKQGKPVIFAQSKRIPKDTPMGEEPQFQFVHDGWVEIVSLEATLKRL